MTVWFHAGIVAKQSTRKVNIMGWTTTDKPSYVPVKEFFRNKFSHDNDVTCVKIIEDAIVEFNTYYAAYEYTNKHTNQRVVSALIVLIDYHGDDRYNFGYKDMTEDCGPYQAKCPERILNMLTETNNEYALSWREACRKYHQNRRDKRAKK